MLRRIGLVVCLTGLPGVSAIMAASYKWTAGCLAFYAGGETIHRAYSWDNSTSIIAPGHFDCTLAITIRDGNIEFSRERLRDQVAFVSQLGAALSSRQKSSNAAIVPFPTPQPSQITLPLYVPLLLLTLGLCFCDPLRHFRFRKRRARGLCQFCGYDLRGSRQRCPECGQI